MEEKLCIKYTEKHQDCYSYIIKCNDAIKLLEDIYPYLFIPTKKKRAKVMLIIYGEFKRPVIFHWSLFHNRLRSCINLFIPLL